MKSIDQVRFITRVADARVEERARRRRRRSARVAREAVPAYERRCDLADSCSTLLEQQMKEAAQALDFETAARLRDQLFELKARWAAGSRLAGSARRPRARER